MRLDPGAASFADARLPANGSRLLNCYAVPRQTEEHQDGAYYLQGCAGLDLVANTGADPCDGLINYNGLLYGVWGNRIVRDVLGTNSVIGAMNGVGMAQFGNDRTGLVVCRPGFTVLVNKVTNFVLPFTLTPTENAAGVAELDGYTIYPVINSDKMYASIPLDPANIQPLNFATAEARPDNIKRIVVNKLTAWMMGVESTEHYYNAGISGFPFIRYNNSMLELGLLSTDSAWAQNNKLFFIGHNRRVYMGEDTGAQAISPPWLETLLATLPAAEIEAVVGLGYVAEGRDFYVITLPSGGTFEFCAQTGLWHHRSSVGYPAWRARGSAFLNGAYYVGDSKNGNVYRIVTNKSDEAGDYILREIITPPFGPKQTRTPLHFVDVALNPVNASTNDSFKLSYSDDDGRTFKAERSVPFPVVGEQRAIQRVLGVMRRRMLKISYAGPAPFRVEDIYIGMGTGWPKVKYQPGQGGGQIQSE